MCGRLCFMAGSSDQMCEWCVCVDETLFRFAAGSSLFRKSEVSFFIFLSKYLNLFLWFFTYASCVRIANDDRCTSLRWWHFIFGKGFGFTCGDIGYDIWLFSCKISTPSDLELAEFEYNISSKEKSNIFARVCSTVFRMTSCGTNE